jgi:DNA-binding beta-propeller fold protein YncE
MAEGGTMKRARHICLYVAITAVVGALGCQQPGVQEAASPAPSQSAENGTAFQADPFWPKDLPKNWLLGQVIGMHVDSRDHIWVLHRYRSLTDSERGASMTPPTSDCCVPAPPVIEFDQEGNVVQAWGGPGEGYTWPEGEHGIFIDFKDFVWIGANSAGVDPKKPDAQVLKFSRDGKFLMAIGEAGKTGGSNDTKLLGRPAEMAVDPKTNELFVADGYGNRRVIVFDADTGAYKRHWGAYGKPPTDDKLAPYNAAEASPIFGDTVHCIAISNDDLVYVCDRMNHRVQVFQRDGTFVKEGFAGRTLAGASMWDVAFSRDAAQSTIYDPDGGNHRVWMLKRDSLETLGSFGRRGRNAGQFESPHSIAVDSKGNLYVGETLGGRRVQRFVPRAAATSN